MESFFSLYFLNLLSAKEMEFQALIFRSDMDLFTYCTFDAWIEKEDVYGTPIHPGSLKMQKREREREKNLRPFCDRNERTHLYFHDLSSCHGIHTILGKYIRFE